MSDVVIPNGWCVATIMDVATASGGGTPSKSDSSYWVHGTLPWVSPKDMKVFLIMTSEDQVTTKALERLSLIPENSILVVVRSGILSRTLPVAINLIPVTVNQDMRAFLPEAGIDARYIAWQFISMERDILDRCSKDGTTVASIEGPALARYPLAIAPRAEQTRIVEKLEELLSDLDAGVAELKTAQRKLAQYRQSLLKAAVEGALTADWRAARAQQLPPPLAGEGWGGGSPQPDIPPQASPPSRPSPASGGRSNAETGAELLQRILAERLARWEAKQLAKFAAQGKTPPKDWRVKYAEPVSPDTAGLPALPEGWVWACAEQLCEFITKGTTPPKDASTKREKTIPFLRVTNLTADGSLDLLDRVFISVETHLGFLSRSVVYPGDVLMNIVGPPLGQVSVVPNDFEQWNINQAIAIFRPFMGTSSQFLCAVLLSNPIQKWLKKRAKTTAGQTNLTLEICRALPFPLPPTSEQDLLIETLRSQLEEQARQSAAVECALKQAAAQRKNILKAAFAGQLVPQDPSDEPASVLLARIRAERAASGTNHNKRGLKVGKSP